LLHRLGFEEHICASQHIIRNLELKKISTCDMMMAKPSSTRRVGDVLSASWTGWKVKRNAHHRAVSPQVDALLAPWLMGRDKGSIFAEAQEQRMPTSPVNTLRDVVEDPHLQDRSFFVTVDREDTGPLTHLGAPYRLSKTPWVIRRPARHLGEHNEEIYSGRLGVSHEEL
jgi:crotonobetainyl-CoA:carnitine CoA-transferase CaiB-like acyl-CoA transferase